MTAIAHPAEPARRGAGSSRCRTASAPANAPPPRISSAVATPDRFSILPCP